jgi:hypothetical protein
VKPRIVRRIRRKPMKVQTLVFAKDGYTAAEAARWAEQHGFGARKVHETAASFRLRQSPPGRFSRRSFRTIAFKPDLKAVVGKLRLAPRKA